MEQSADLRYVGQSFELTVLVGDGVPESGFLDGLREAFEAEHERTYGHRAEDDPVEVAAWRLRASLPAPDMALLEPPASGGSGRTRRAYFGDPHGWMDTPVLNRGDLSTELNPGPMIVEDYDATTLVPPDAGAWRDEWGNIVIETAEGIVD